MKQWAAAPASQPGGADGQAAVDVQRLPGHVARQRMQQKTDGMGECDHSALARYYEKLAKVEISR